MRINKLLITTNTQLKCNFKRNCNKVLAWNKTNFKNYIDKFNRKNVVYPFCGGLDRPIKFDKYHIFLNYYSLFDEQIIHVKSTKQTFLVKSMTNVEDCFMLIPINQLYSNEININRVYYAIKPQIYSENCRKYHRKMSKPLIEFEAISTFEEKSKYDLYNCHGKFETPYKNKTWQNPALWKR